MTRSVGRGRGSWRGLGLLVFVGVCACGLLRLQIDNSPRVFFPDDAKAVARHDAVARRFGAVEEVRVVVRGPSLWQPGTSTWLESLEDRLQSLPGVTRASGPAGWSRLVGLEWPPSSPEAWLDRARRSTLARALGWVDAEGSLLSLTVELASPASLEGVPWLLATGPPGVMVEMTGLPAVNRALDASAAEVQQVFLPLLVGVSAALLLLALGRLGDVARLLAFVAVVEIVTLGLLGWIGLTLNLVTAILTPLVFAISLATGVHVLLAVDRHRGDVASAIRDKGWAVWWAGLTTALGFLSLATARVAPVRQLGWGAALGVAAMLALVWTLLPRLLGGRRADSGRRPAARLRRLGRDVAGLAVRYRAAVFLSFGAAFVAGLAGLPRLEVSTDALTYFPAESPVRRAIDSLTAAGVGPVALQLTLESPDDPWTAATGRTLEPLLPRLRTVPGVLGAAGLPDLVAEATAVRPSLAMMLPGSRWSTAIAALGASVPGRRALGAFVADDPRWTRVLVLVAPMTAHEAEVLAADLLGEVERTVPGAQARLTGTLLLVLEAQTHLLAALATSVLLTGLGVAVVFLLALRSPRLTLLALPPNLWPIVVTLGAMGWLSVPIDVATVMVAAVVLGLAVDATIHTLGRYRLLAGRRGGSAPAVLAVAMSAPAHVVTGLTLALGFGVCTLSAFAPTARFGRLAVLAIGLALVGDLVLVPALLTLDRPSGSGPGGRRRRTPIGSSAREKQETGSAPQKAAHFHGS